MFNSKYVGSVTIVDEEGNVILERELSSDEMIDEFRKLVTASTETIDTGLVVTEMNVGEVFAVAKKKVEKQLDDRPTFFQKIKKEKSETTSTEEAILSLAKKGMKSAAIAKELDLHVHEVYRVKSLAKRKESFKEFSKPPETEKQSEEEETNSQKHEEILDMLQEGIYEKDITKRLGLRKGIVPMVKYAAEKRGVVFPDATRHIDPD